MILKLRKICKTFFGNSVLDDIDLDVKAGETHAIIGGNGAGKSTLINIVSGALTADSGKVYIENREAHIASPQDASRLGISVIHQSPSIIPDMTVAENIFLGNQPRFLKLFVNKRKMIRESSRILRALGIVINPEIKAKLVPPREHYLISIARAFCHKSKMMIMDEPTASLSEDERERLFSLIRQYKNEGMGILYITHRMEEVKLICDRVTIIRDGKKVITAEVDTLETNEMIALMMGREVEQYFPPLQHQYGEVLLRVEKLSKWPALKEVSFQLRQGEIVGVTGLASSGKSILARTIFGQKERDSGEIYWKGEPVHFKHPFQAIQQRFGYVDENRLKAGLFKNMTVSDNLTISSLSKLNNWYFMRDKEATNLSIEQIMELDIKMNDLKQTIEFLSGGNQQKVMIGRCLMADSEMFILDEPTRGIDVGSRSDIYLKIHELAAEGKGILLITSDVTELLGLCSTVLVMRQGELVATIANDGLSQQELVQLVHEGEEAPGLRRQA